MGVTRSIGIVLVLAAAHTLVFAKTNIRNETLPAPPDVRGTASAPIVVAVTESASDSAEKARAELHRDEDAKNNRLIMLFTGGTMCVGFVQLGLFWWQLRLMRANIKDGALVAKAAELNARASIGIELPVIRFSPLELGSTDHLIPNDNSPYGAGISDGPPSKYSALGDFRVTNHGRTPAFPIAFAVGWAFTDVLPPEPTYIQRSVIDHAKVVVAGGEVECHLDGPHLGIELSDEQLAAGATNKIWLWVYGCLYFLDFLDQPREARFCWRYADRNHDLPFYFLASDGEPPPAYVAKV